jgi:hypothetical protein
VYDPERHVAHCLNSTAAAVWLHCDGREDIAGIAASLSRQNSASVDEAIVSSAVAKLEKAHLLEERDVGNSSRVTRRDVIRKMGIAAAIAMPVITSIVVPTPAQAASCLHNNSPCATNAMCCSGICVPVVGRCLGG